MDACLVLLVGAAAALPMGVVPSVNNAIEQMNAPIADDMAGVNAMSRTEAMAQPAPAPTLLDEFKTHDEDWMPPLAEQEKLASEGYEDSAMVGAGENLMNEGDSGVDEEREAEEARTTMDASVDRMNSDEGFASDNGMISTPVFSYAALKQPAPEASLGGGDADAIDDEEAGSGGDMNEGESSMNGDTRMNVLASDMATMPLSSDPTISMPSEGESEEQSAYSTMNKGAVAPKKAAAVMGGAPTTAPAPADDKRATLIKAVLSAGDLAMEAQHHVSGADLRADNSMEMADMSHMNSATIAGDRGIAAPTMQQAPTGEKAGFMDEGEAFQGDINGQMNANPSSGLNMMAATEGGDVALLEVSQSQYGNQMMQQQGQEPPPPPSAPQAPDQQMLAQFSGQQYAQGPPMPPPGTPSPLVPLTPIMNGTQPIQVPVPMHPYGVPYFHRDPFMPLQTPYYHVPAFDNPQKNPALTPYYNPYVNPPPPIPPSVPAAPSFFPYHHHQHMIPPYFPYPPAPIIQPGPFAPYALPSHLAPGKLGPDASVSKLPPLGDDPF